MKYRTNEVDLKVAKRKDYLSRLQQKYLLKKNQLDNQATCVPSLQQLEKFRLLKAIDNLEQDIISKELEVLALPSVKGYPFLE